MRLADGPRRFVVNFSTSVRGPIPKQRWLNSSGNGLTLSKGKMPPVANIGDGFTIADLCNAFLIEKESRAANGELSERTFVVWHAICRKIVEQFGRERLVGDLQPEDFGKFRRSLAAKHSTITLLNLVNQVRSVFNWGFKNRLMKQPADFGTLFDRPSRKLERKARRDAGVRMFEADEIRGMLQAADVPMRAASLLGINGGFGNGDVSALPQSAIDFDGN